MKYPNAKDGVNKIYMSEIIALAASIIMLVCSVLALLIHEKKELIILTGILSLVILAALAIYIVSYFLQIAGIVRASKDEPSFKVSLYAIIALILITVLEIVFEVVSLENHFITFILEIAGDVAQFFLVHYIIHGIMHLTEHLGRPDMIKKGNIIFRVIYIAIAFEIIVRIFEIIFGKERGESLSLPFGIVANILKTVEYILFLTYIGKGNRILKENDTDIQT